MTWLSRESYHDRLKLRITAMGRTLNFHRGESIIGSRGMACCTSSSLPKARCDTAIVGYEPSSGIKSVKLDVHFSVLLIQWMPIPR